MNHIINISPDKKSVIESITKNVTEDIEPRFAYE